MQRIIGALAMALAVVALPQLAAAQDGRRPERPNPEALFNRLDANHDGVITPDEIPAAMPDRLKHLLREADTNHDGRITKQELIAAIRARHPGRPEGPEQKPAHPGPQGGPRGFAFGFGGGGPGPQGGHPALRGEQGGAAFGFGVAGPQPSFAHPAPAGPLSRTSVTGPFGPSFGQPGVHGPQPPVRADGTGTVVVNGNLIINGGTVIINGGTLVVGGPAGALKGPATPARPLGRPMGHGAMSPMFNARAIFNRLDTDHDGKLSFEEFAVGVRHLHQFLAGRISELQRPFWDRIRSFRGRLGPFQGHPTHPGMGPMGGHPGMGPMGPHPGMGPMGGHPGMGPMGGHPDMGPMGGHPGMGPMGPRPGMGPLGFLRAFDGQQGTEKGKVIVRVFTSSDGGKPGVKMLGICKCQAKKQAVCKCGAKTPEACTCGKKHVEKKCEPAKAAGHRSIEERLTALEAQQAEILKLLRSVSKHDHHGHGER